MSFQVPTRHNSKLQHHLERTADRVVNICEWVVFAVTGEMAELNVN
jgi:phosphate uptake regulator